MNKMNRKIAVVVILMIIVLVICVIKLILIGVNTQRSTIVPNVTQSIHSTYRNYNINTAKPKASVKVKSSVNTIKKYRK